MAGARAVGAVGRESGSSSAASACRRSRVRTGIRCPPCRPRSTGDPVVRGVRGQALSSLWLPSFGAGVGHALLSSLRVWGPSTGPAACMPCGAACRGGGGGPSPGGLACHCCEGRLVSGAVPPPAARSLRRAAGVPRPVCPRCGRRGRGDPAPAPLRAPLWPGVPRCGGGKRASPGGVPFAVVRGV